MLRGELEIFFFAPGSRAEYADSVILKKRKRIRGFADKLKGKPLLDMLGAIVEDYDYLWDQYYFSTATM